jgi:hypothetical protein
MTDQQPVLTEEVIKEAGSREPVFVVGDVVHEAIAALAAKDETIRQQANDLTILRDRLESLRKFYDCEPWESLRKAEARLSDAEATITRQSAALKNLWQMTPCECRIDKDGSRTYTCEACEVYESAIAPSSDITPTPGDPP